MKTKEYFQSAFIQEMMQKSRPSTIEVTKVEVFDVDNSASILSTLNASTTGQEIGHFGLAVKYREDSRFFEKKMVMKVKPHGKVTAGMLNQLAEICGGDLQRVYSKLQQFTGFSNTHWREMEVYKKMKHPIQPEIFGLMVDESTETFLILMEYFEGVEMLNSVMEPEKWTHNHIQQALLQIADWHAKYLGKETGLNLAYWQNDLPSKHYMLKMLPLWKELLDQAASVMPEVYTKENYDILKNAIDYIPVYWKELENESKTLIHNDFNPRNTFFRRNQNKLQLCLYDWELATFHVPHYDVAEFLSFVLTPERYHERLTYLEIYRQEMENLTGKFKDKEQFQKIFAYAALDFGLHRLGMYAMAHRVNPYPFLPRVAHSYFSTLQQLKPLLPQSLFV